jgi:hypothetical protein
MLTRSGRIVRPKMNVSRIRTGTNSGIRKQRVDSSSKGKENNTTGCIVINGLTSAYHSQFSGLSNTHCNRTTNTYTNVKNYTNEDIKASENDGVYEEDMVASENDEVYDDDDDDTVGAQEGKQGAAHKHHPLLGVVETMKSGGVYLHCGCGHVRRVEEAWARKVPLDSPGFVDQMQPCPHSLYRRTNSFKKMKLHIKKCISTVKGGRAEEVELPPMFRRTYNNKVMVSKPSKLSYSLTKNRND